MPRWSKSEKLRNRLFLGLENLKSTKNLKFGMFSQIGKTLKSANYTYVVPAKYCKLFTITLGILKI